MDGVLYNLMKDIPTILGNQVSSIIQDFIAGEDLSPGDIVSPFGDGIAVKNLFQGVDQLNIISGTSQTPGRLRALDTSHALYVYWQSSNFYAAIVTASGTTITIGTPTLLWSGASIPAWAPTLQRIGNTNNFFTVGVQGANTQARIITVDPTTYAITLGNDCNVATSLNAGSQGGVTTTGDKAVVFYFSNYWLYATVLTISGTTLTKTTSTAVHQGYNGSPYGVSCAIGISDKTVALNYYITPYQNANTVGNMLYVKINADNTIVPTITTHVSGNINWYGDMVLVDTSKFLICFAQQGANTYFKLVTFNDTTLAEAQVGTTTQFVTGQYSSKLDIDPVTGQIVNYMKFGSNDTLSAIVLNAITGVVTWNSKNITTNVGDYPAVALLGKNKILHIHQYTTSVYGGIQVIKSDNTVSWGGLGEVDGIVLAAATKGNTVTVLLHGYTPKGLLTGLAVGIPYYRGADAKISKFNYYSNQKGIAINKDVLLLINSVFNGR